MSKVVADRTTGKTPRTCFREAEGTGISEAENAIRESRANRRISSATVYELQRARHSRHRSLPPPSPLNVPIHAWLHIRHCPTIILPGIENSVSLSVAAVARSWVVTSSAIAAPTYISIEGK